MPCKLPFYPNINYVNQAEHDANTRKFYYLVYGYRLFTKKCVYSAARTTETDAICSERTPTLCASRTTSIFSSRGNKLAWDQECAEGHDHDEPSRAMSTGASACPISSRAPASRGTTPRTAPRATPSARASSTAASARQVHARMTPHTGKRAATRSTASQKPKPKTRSVAKIMPLYDEDSDEAVAVKPKKSSCSPIKAVPLYDDDDSDGLEEALYSAEDAAVSPVSDVDQDEAAPVSVPPDLALFTWPFAKRPWSPKRESSCTCLLWGRMLGFLGILPMPQHLRNGHHSAGTVFAINPSSIP
ncbi:hypothetical protein B0H12DRAFT_1239584 [Mycena haematopus]|nr:hypothetical protein B0H12DRAFT_1239584 [Mycena haematopus]